jgi:hypothetical protein
LRKPTGYMVYRYRLASLQATWYRLASLQATWYRLASLQATWYRLASLQATWYRLASLSQKIKVEITVSKFKSKCVYFHITLVNQSIRVNYKLMTVLILRFTT